jgi:fructose-1,6-bisphosphatase-3
MAHSHTAAHIEMINLSAILALPKGTDHSISDIHGAYAQFDHILRHTSGAIRRKVAQTFAAELTDAEQVELAMLIYYPEQQLRAVLAADEAPVAWMAQTIARLARVARTAAQKYTRSKVRKRLPRQLAYILEELLTESQFEHTQKERYYTSIVQAIVDLGEAETVIVALAELIHTLVVDRLFILGDIYDRGSAAERVMDRLMAYHSVAILWGNHDIAWMGGASGCDALLANVVRIALRYATLVTLVDGYAISLRSLAHFAAATYADDHCAVFQPKAGPPVSVVRPAVAAVRPCAHDYLRALLHRRQSHTRRGKRAVLCNARERSLLSQGAHGLRRRRRAGAHYQRPHAGESPQRGAPTAGKWPADRDRRRDERGVSGGDGNRRVHTDRQLARVGLGSARAVQRD